MDFPKNFPDTKLIKLEENFRSTQPILGLTNTIIGSAKEKYTKCLFTKRKGGVLPQLVSAADETSQSEWITEKIKQYRKNGSNLRDIAVLFRSSFHSFDLEVKLAKAGIPFAKYGGLKFAEAAHIKDVLAHLRVFQNPQDHLAWHRILTLLPGIGSVTARKIIAWVDSRPSLERFQEYIDKEKKKIRVLEELSELFTQLSQPEVTVNSQVEMVRKYYESFMVKKFDNYPKRLKDLDYLQEWSVPFTNLEQFLTDMALEPPQVNRAPSDFLDRPDFLTLSTIHSAKGLEWDVVFLIHAADGLFPSSHYLFKEDELEEERRLMYVACTRAKNQLLITYPEIGRDSYYGDNSLDASEFIRGIGADLLKRTNARGMLGRAKSLRTDSYGRKSIKTPRGITLTVGDVMKHPELGTGIILELVSHNKARIFFKKSGIRTIDIRSTKLGKVG